MQWTFNIESFSQAEEFVVAAKAHHATFAFHLYGAFKPRDNSVVDEVLQRFYIKLWKKFDRIKKAAPDKTLSFLLKMLRNEYIDYLRSEKNGNRAELEEIEPQQASVGLYHACPGEAHEDILLQLKRILKPKYYEVMRLQLEGFGYQEIAEIMDMPIGTVGTIISRAKEKLRDHFEE